MSVDTLVEQIKRLHAEEVAADRPALTANDIPLSYEAITPAWMTDVLCKQTPGAEVTRVRLDERDSGSTNRRRIFVEYNEAGEAAGLPGSVFCKATQGLLNRINLAICGCIHAENVFFNRIRPLMDLETPRAIHAAYDPESFNSIIVLHDMAGEVTFCDYDHRIDHALACSLVDLLVKLHSQFWQHPEINAQTMALPTFPEFWHMIERNEQAAYCDKGFRESEDIIPARLYARADEVWPATLKSVDLQNHYPHTLLQGDCHLKQWYVRNATGTMGLTDWQGACFGDWARDFSYALGTALEIEDRRSWEKELLQRYLDGMKSAGIDMPSWDDAWLRYRHNMLPALGFWTITLTPAPQMPDMQPRAAAVQFIERLAAACDDLQSIDAAYEAEVPA